MKKLMYILCLCFLVGCSNSFEVSKEEADLLIQTVEDNLISYNGNNYKLNYDGNNYYEYVKSDNEVWTTIQGEKTYYTYSNNEVSIEKDSEITTINMNEDTFYATYAMYTIDLDLSMYSSLKTSKNGYFKYYNLTMESDQKCVVNFPNSTEVVTLSSLKITIRQIDDKLDSLQLSILGYDEGGVLTSITIS